MHAAVFNDGAPFHFLMRLTEIGPHLDLIPLDHFLELYHHSPMLAVYIYGVCVRNLLLPDCGMLICP
jgi:hypothetical protein